MLTFYYVFMVVGKTVSTISRISTAMLADKVLLAMLLHTSKFAWDGFDVIEAGKQVFYSL